MTGFIDLSPAEFAALAAPRSVPGSGSVAAAVGALGAGLVSMALDPLRGEPRATFTAPASHSRLADAGELRGGLEPLPAREPARAVLEQVRDTLECSTAPCS